jgi:hypothetical protein
VKNFKLLGFILFLVFVSTLFYFYLRNKSVDFKNDKTTINYIRNNFDTSSINYFKEIAFSAEFNEKIDYLMKWNKDTIYVFIAGNPSITDSLNLEDHINTLNDILLSTKLKICNNKFDADIKVYYLSKSEAMVKFENFSSYNRGLFQVYCNLRKEIINADVIISISESAQIRRETLLEELTQSLGLMDDSETHIESLFYNDFKFNRFLSKTDIDLIKILYNSGIKSGVTKKEFSEVFK